jgi:hypothetical protein
MDGRLSLLLRAILKKHCGAVRRPPTVWPPSCLLSENSFLFSREVRKTTDDKRQ